MSPYIGFDFDACRELRAAQFRNAIVPDGGT